MLVCAPTGAGKTNIAMIAVLHEVSQHRNASSGVIDKDNFKIVYVAPMKALAGGSHAHIWHPACRRSACRCAGMRSRPLPVVVLSRLITSAPLGASCSMLQEHVPCLAMSADMIAPQLPFSDLSDRPASLL